MKGILGTASVLSLSIALLPSAGHAQTGGGEVASIEEIVVTAQKREERINDVPLAITAMTGDQLESQGVNETADLARVVPGFNYQSSLSGSPVFYIRGVGFADYSPSATPAVTVYADEVPLSLSDMSRGAALDLARVEVLKGPQGTLFGGNSTGGAVNYIAAKPTDTLEAGAGIGFGRFGAANVQGYLSGPLGSRVSARVAGEYRMQGDWQYSATRPGDTRGQKDFLNGRISIAAEPTDGLKLLLTASGWRDRSDAPNLQFVQVFPSAPFPPVIDALNAVAYVPTNARITDWLPGTNKRRDDSFYQFSLRGDLDISENIQLTSITAYSKLSFNSPSQIDGLNFPAYTWTVAKGEVFSQELRLAGDISSLHWMIGGNYQHTKAPVSTFGNPIITSNAQGLYSSIHMLNNQQVDDYAVFGSLEAKLSDTITARGSVRYSKQNRDHQGCLADFGDGQLAFGFGQVIIPFLLGGAPTNIPNGACVTLDDATNTVIPGPSESSLNEDNVSWRLGLDWKASPDTLVYATVAKGYKSGSYSILPAVYVSQMDPVTQESLIAYEVGLKTDLLARKVHVDLSGFYYDYRDKQLLGYVNIFPFGPLPTLVNIPTSRVIGGEVALTARPTDTLRIQLSGAVLDTKVKTNPSNPLDPFGNPASFVGESFPSTPKYQLNADVEQSFALSDKATGYLGGSLQYRSSASGTFGSTTSAQARLLTTLPSYVTLDIRAGVRLADPDLKVEIWGSNVTNKYYYNSAYQYADAFLRLPAMPATWGIRLSVDY